MTTVNGFTYDPAVQTWRKQVRPDPRAPHVPRWLVVKGDDNNPPAVESIARACMHSADGRICEMCQQFEDIRNGRWKPPPLNLTVEQIAAIDALPVEALCKQPSTDAEWLASIRESGRWE